MERETITISLEVYRGLMREALKLRALESGGVDNWSWYMEAMAEYREEAKKLGLIDDEGQET